MIEITNVTWDGERDCKAPGPGGEQHLREHACNRDAQVGGQFHHISIGIRTLGDGGQGCGLTASDKISVTNPTAGALQEMPHSPL